MQDKSFYGILSVVMIERFFEKLIEELGATGLLVIGLYFILHRPLNSMARHIHHINDEISKMYKLMVELSKADES